MLGINLTSVLIKNVPALSSELHKAASIKLDAVSLMLVVCEEVAVSCDAAEEYVVAAAKTMQTHKTNATIFLNFVFIFLAS
ncbi:hypothetical protein SDC9_91146 [bioreactor metagenome]|uniref:Uncharacterized protein n=1 Tax=bioreactor metagenome TaxID=1076179 RepID=A0A644ZVL2_9ZZZZ